MRQNLILVPTRREVRILLEQCPELRSEEIQVCGFGCVASTLMSSRVLMNRRADHVFLIGIAGRYQRSLDLGKAYVFGRVSLFGIGIGSGSDFKLPSEIGFPDLYREREQVISETMDLDGFPLWESPNAAGQLLTVASAANNPQEVQQRMVKFPDAVAEDMETFGVSASCRLAGQPFTVIRGISNDAGDRVHANWKIDESLLAAGKLFLSLKNGPT